MHGYMDMPLSYNDKGLYVLLVDLDKEIDITVGALGNINFKAGSYAYAGRAKRGLGKRLERHLSSNKRNRWHIDYLTSNDTAKVRKIFILDCEPEIEAELAAILSSRFDPVPNFGSSDTLAKSHLFIVDGDVEQLLNIFSKEHKARLFARELQDEGKEF